MIVLAKIAAFFTSKLGLYAIAAIVIAAVWGHGYVKGSAHVRAQCEEKARQAAAAADKQDKAAAEKIVVQEKVVDQELIELSKRQADRIKELENATPLSPSCVYPMPDPRKQPSRGVRGVPAQPGARN